MIIKPAVSRRLVSRRRRGISLFQVLMGLALFAATLIGAVSLYTSATETQRLNEAQTLLTRLTVAVGRIHQGLATYGTSSLVADLAHRGAIPSSAVAGSTSNPRIRHPFGDFVTVVGAGATYVITFQDLDNETCALLIDPYLGQTTGTTGLEKIAVGSTDVDLTRARGARAACTAGGGANDVAFTFQ